MLDGIGALGFARHEDPAVKDRMGLVLQHPFVELTAEGVRLEMAQGRVMIDMLAPGRHVETGERGLCPIALKLNFQVVAHKPPAKIEGKAVITGFTAERGAGRGEVIGGLALTLDNIMIQPAPAADHNVSHGIGKIALTAAAGITFDEQRLRLLSQNHHHPRMDDGLGGIDIVVNLQRHQQRHAVRYEYDHPLIGQGAVEQSERLLSTHSRLRHAPGGEFLHPVAQHGESLHGKGNLRPRQTGVGLAETAVDEDETIGRGIHTQLRQRQIRSLRTLGCPAPRRLGDR